MSEVRSDPTRRTGSERDEDAPNPLQPASDRETDESEYVTPRDVPDHGFPARPPMRTAAERLAGRSALRLFAHGTGDVAVLRAWDGWTQWNFRSPAQKVLHIARSLALPVVAAQRAVLGVREHGRDVARAHGVSVPRQLADLWWLRVRYGLIAPTYYMLRLFLPERRRRAGAFVQTSELDRVQRLLIARTAPRESAILADKRLFASWCEEHGLPHAETIVEIDARDGLRPDLSAVRLPAADLFSKPRTARSGYDAELWRFESEANGWRGPGGRIRSASEMLEELSELSRRTRRAQLVQRRLVNHPDLLPLAPLALSTVRVVTYRALDEEPRVLLAVLRMAAPGSSADNVSQGGLAASVDLESGRLGVAVKMQGMLTVEMEQHPDTGARVPSRILPHWKATLELALRAHGAARSLVIVGWDIAITAEGPVLIEGNRYPGARISQFATGLPLGETPYVRCITDHLRASYGL